MRPAFRPENAIPQVEFSPLFELGKTETTTPVPFGVRKVDMPLTPERVWRAIRDAEGGH